MSHRDLKGFIYKYNEILISSAIVKLFIIMKCNGNMKIKICDKYSLFYKNMNASQRQLSGINTPKYISCVKMRTATSSLDSAIQNINSLGDNEWHDLLVAFYWKFTFKDNVVIKEEADVHCGGYGFFKPFAFVFFLIAPLFL